MGSNDNFHLGVASAIGSAFSFAMSGPFAKPLMDAGWTPIAAVTARLVGGALVMALFATIVHRGWLGEAIRHLKTVAVYGLIPIAGAQLCFFNAVAHLPVGVALLLQSLAPVLVIGWIWGTTRRRPATLTLVGTALALAGTAAVLDVCCGPRIDTNGVAWALATAVCVACYFVLSDRVATDGSALNSVTLAAGGLIAASAVVVLLDLTGIQPVAFSTHDAVVAGHSSSFLLPVMVLGVVSAALAYVLGISSVARLRPSYAALLALAEVPFGVLCAWMLLGRAVTAAQAVGGVVALVGLTLAGRGQRPEVPTAMWTDAVPADGLADEPPVRAA